MKHASSRALTAYWNERRGPHRAPERGDIEPGAIRQVLGDTFILAFDPPWGHPYRLAGTRLCALFGRELKSEAFLAAWTGADRDAMADLVTACTTEANGIVASLTGTTREGWSQDLELLLLPLRHRGEQNLRLIGVLAPLTPPFWLGSSRIETVRLGTFRYLAAAQEIAAPQIAPSGPVAVTVRREQIFTVYEGNRR
jgi:hypothetical protein